MLTNQDIKEKLKEYKKCDDIRKVSIGTHIRYFTVDTQTKEKVFRLGGTLNKIDPEGRFVILGNGSISWSVQILGTQFWQKLTEAEFKEELKKELKKEIEKELVTEDMSGIDSMIEQENKELKKELKSLMKKFEKLEEENKCLIKKNEQLGSQLSKIALEVKKEKKAK
jgi:hypothetical protein